MSSPGTIRRYSPDNLPDFHEEIGLCRGGEKELGEK